MGQSREVELRVGLSKVASAEILMRSYYEDLVNKKFDVDFVNSTLGALQGDLELATKALLAGRAIRALGLVMSDIEDLKELEQRNEIVE